MDIGASLDLVHKLGRFLLERLHRSGFDLLLRDQQPSLIRLYELGIFLFCFYNGLLAGQLRRPRLLWLRLTENLFD